MANVTARNLCPPPFIQDTLFDQKGYVEGRLCRTIPQTSLTCCLPCPMTDWAYPDSFQTIGTGAQWVSVMGVVACVGLLISWAVLPVEKTFRHYLSICLTTAVLFMSLGFVIPLAAQPDECYDAITPHSMHTSAVCAASGTFLVLGGWAGVMWVFLRAMSLHLQICWQVVVGRNFMWFSQAVGWGIPVIGVVCAIVFSGFSFRFGSTCHINHKNSLADLWIPLLVFAGLTIIIQFSTFGYCIKVYLASLADNSASTEGSGLPSYTNSIRTMTPKQAYRRVRRVIELQWRGIAIVLIIITDVIFFSIVFVFQDTTVEAVKRNGDIASEWVTCLFYNQGNKEACLPKADPLVVNMPTVGAVLFLLGMNGIWLALFLGRWSMFTGWHELLFGSFSERNKKEFVSVDARLDDLKKDTLTPVSPMAKLPLRSPSSLPHDSRRDSSNDGRRTPDYFGQTARYHAPVRSFSNPRPPQQHPTVTWDARQTYARPKQAEDEYVNPLGLNRI